MAAPTSNLGDIDTVIRRRLDEFLESMGKASKLTIAASPDMFQMFLRLAQAAPAINPVDKNAAERIARVAEFKRGLLSKSGGALTTKQVKNLLGYKSAQAVHKAESARRLLAVDDNGTKLFPAFQFDGESILPGMRAILEATPNTSAWELLQYMVEGDEGLGNDLPMNLIRQGDEAIERAVRFARTMEV